MSTATRSRKGLRKMLVSVMVAMMLVTGFAPAALAGDGDRAKGGDGGDGGLIGIGIGLCLIASCDDVGSDNGSGGDGGDAEDD